MISFSIVGSGEVDGISARDLHATDGTPKVNATTPIY